MGPWANVHRTLVQLLESCNCEYALLAVPLRPYWGVSMHPHCAIGAATMPSRRPLSVSSQVVLALLLGALVGLFFGEQIAFFQNIGKAFILLLQMTVLPYIVLSLMTGLGHLTYQQVKAL